MDCVSLLITHHSLLIDRYSNIKSNMPPLTPPAWAFTFTTASSRCIVQRKKLGRKIQRSPLARLIIVVSLCPWRYKKMILQGFHLERKPLRFIPPSQQGTTISFVFYFLSRSITLIDLKIPFNQSGTNVEIQGYLFHPVGPNHQLFMPTYVSA
jgi:hypothetical protein